MSFSERQLEDDGAVGRKIVEADGFRDDIHHPHARVERRVRVLEYHLDREALAIRFLALKTGAVAAMEQDLAWQQGMQRPLPVAVQTAFAWLGQSDEAKAQAAARKTYEGDGQTTQGERAQSTALARQFPDFDALLDSEEFVGWCESLYKPVYEAPWQSLSSEEAAA